MADFGGSGAYIVKGSDTLSFNLDVDKHIDGATPNNNVGLSGQAELTDIVSLESGTAFLFSNNLKEPDTIAGSMIITTNNDNGEIDRFATTSYSDFYDKESAVISTNNKVYIIGGSEITGVLSGDTLTYSEESLNECYLLDSADSANISTDDITQVTDFSTGPVLPHSCKNSGAIILDRLYIVGGPAGTIGTADVNLSTGVISGYRNHTVSMPSDLIHNTLKIIGNHAYMFGGVSAVDGTLSDIVYRADIAGNQLGAFTATSVSLPTPLGRVNSVSTKNAIYIFGGITSTYTADPEAVVTYSKSIYKADIAEDGTISEFVEQSVSLPEFTLYEPAVSGDKLYLFSQNKNYSNLYIEFDGWDTRDNVQVGEYNTLDVTEHNLRQLPEHVYIDSEIKFSTAKEDNVDQLFVADGTGVDLAIAEIPAANTVTLTHAEPLKVGSGVVDTNTHIGYSVISSTINVAGSTIDVVLDGDIVGVPDTLAVSENDLPVARQSRRYRDGVFTNTYGGDRNALEGPGNDILEQATYNVSYDSGADVTTSATVVPNVGDDLRDPTDDTMYDVVAVNTTGAAPVNLNTHYNLAQQDVGELFGLALPASPVYISDQPFYENLKPLNFSIGDHFYTITVSDTDVYMSVGILTGTDLVMGELTITTIDIFSISGTYNLAGDVLVIGNYVYIFLVDIETGELGNTVTEYMWRASINSDNTISAFTEVTGLTAGWAPRAFGFATKDNVLYTYIMEYNNITSVVEMKLYTSQLDSLGGIMDITYSGIVTRTVGSNITSFSARSNNGLNVSYDNSTNMVYVYDTLSFILYTTTFDDMTNLTSIMGKELIATNTILLTKNNLYALSSDALIALTLDINGQVTGLTGGTPGNTPYPYPTSYTYEYMDLSNDPLGYDYDTFDLLVIDNKLAIVRTTDPDFGDKEQYISIIDVGWSGIDDNAIRTGAPMTVITLDKDVVNTSITSLVDDIVHAVDDPTAGSDETFNAVQRKLNIEKAGTELLIPFTSELYAN